MHRNLMSPHDIPLQTYAKFLLVATASMHTTIDRNPDQSQPNGRP